MSERILPILGKGFFSIGKRKYGLLNRILDFRPRLFERLTTTDYTKERYTSSETGSEKYSESPIITEEKIWKERVLELIREGEGYGRIVSIISKEYPEVAIDEFVSYMNKVYPKYPISPLIRPEPVSLGWARIYTIYPTLAVDIAKRFKGVPYVEAFPYYVEVPKDYEKMARAYRNEKEQEYEKKWVEVEKEKFSESLTQMICWHCGTPFSEGNAEFCEECVPEDTIILTQEGYKPINQINIGEKLLGVGKPDTVIKTYKRPYNGSIVEVKATCILPIRLTPMHPVLVAKVYRKKISRKPHRIRKFVKEVLWKKAKDIRVGDYLLVPKNISSGINSPTFKNYLRKKGPKPIYDGTITPNIADLFGRIIADGCGCKSGNSTDIAFSKNEDCSHYSKVINEELHFTPRTIEAETCNKLIIPSHVFNRMICEEFYSPINGKRRGMKSVPPIFFETNKENIERFILGYMGGDGHLYEQYNNWSATTSSLGLALQIQLLTAKIGSMSALYHTKLQATHKIGNRPIKAGEHWRIYWQPNAKKRESFEQWDYIFVPVTSVSEVQYSGNVCNLTTESNIIIINNIITHNCSTFKCPYGHCFCTLSEGEKKAVERAMQTYGHWSEGKRKKRRR